MKKGMGFVLFVLVLIGVYYFDFEIIEAVSSIRNGFLDNFFLIITYLSNEFIIFCFLTGLFLWKKKNMLSLWISMGLAVVISFLLKIVVQRKRPFQINLVSLLPVLEKASHNVWNFSFPSFQTMLVFCCVPIIAKKFPKIKIYWIIFAVLVALSRVYFGLHFASDIIAGGLIGYLIGWIVVRKIKK